ncbi:hypothetical protein J6590_078182 [Homalodisca vitripennis]|nr:hypothetical protein J6590_078182 [Homalodisca vitripennis]
MSIESVKLHPQGCDRCSMIVTKHIESCLTIETVQLLPQGSDRCSKIVTKHIESCLVSTAIFRPLTQYNFIPREVIVMFGEYRYLQTIETVQVARRLGHQDGPTINLITSTVDIGDMDTDNTPMEFLRESDNYVQQFNNSFMNTTHRVVCYDTANAQPPTGGVYQVPAPINITRLILLFKVGYIGEG